MRVDLEKPGTPYELVHHGIKGMKWGVHRTQGTHDFKRRFPTAKSRKAEILRARASVHADARVNNPDRATALRMTRGEKVVTSLLYSLAPTVVIPAAVAGVTLYRVGKRRSLES